MLKSTTARSIFGRNRIRLITLHPQSESKERWMLELKKSSHKVVSITIIVMSLLHWKADLASSWSAHVVVHEVHNWVRRMMIFFSSRFLSSFKPIVVSKEEACRLDSAWHLHVLLHKCLVLLSIRYYDIVLWATKNIDYSF